MNRGRSNRQVSLRDPAPTADEAREANEAMSHKLRRNSLRRRASARGLQLRHSAYGYSLIDTTRKRVDGRNDMTLDDVETYLARET